MTDAPPPDPASPQPRDASLGEIFRAVFWSFFGVRKRKHMLQDAVRIRPHQVIIVGVVSAALFVVTLLLLVRLIIRSTGA